MEWYYHEIFCGWAVLSIFAMFSGIAIAVEKDKPLAPLLLFLFATASIGVLAVILWVWNHLLFSVLFLIITTAVVKCYCKIGKNKRA